MSSALPLVLVGNALSLMVAATRLARRGIAVTVVNGGRNWGGHFTTVNVGGLAFDPGMVLHEFTSFSMPDAEPDVRSYDPSVRNDAGRFCTAVRRYVNYYQQTRDIVTPQMMVAGRQFDDLLVANGLRALPQLPFAEAMRLELECIVAVGADSMLHAAHKHRGSGFNKLPYEEVSKANHGETLHAKLLEPFCRKLLAKPSSEVVALYHRAAWLPLFYPETLLSYLEGRPQPLPATVFSYPVGECLGELANKLRQEIEAHPLITVISGYPSRIAPRTGGGYDISFVDRDDVASAHLAWGGSLGDLLATFGQPQSKVGIERCSIALAFLRVPARSLKMGFSVLSIVDEDLAVYRVTNQSLCAGEDGEYVRLVAELNPDHAGAEGDALRARVLQDLVDAGVVDCADVIDCLHLIVIKNALMLPNLVNHQATLAEMAAVTALAPDISLMGPASGFFSSSFSDQIVQGLKLSASWSQ